MTAHATTPGRQRVAARLDDVHISGIREVFEALTRWAARTGGTLVPFHFGMPDFDTPGHIKQAAIDALGAGVVKYTSSLGLPELRRALARKLQRENGMTVDTETEMVITCGANEAVAAAILALVDPGDEVIMPDPAWPHYDACLRIAGATPVRCTLRESDGFAMDPDAVAAAWTPRTRMVIINSPHNPTGAVMSPEAIHAIARLARDRGAWLLSDEAYERLLFEGTHLSPASHDDVREAVITAGCLSKTYAMTGWRIGYVCGPPQAIDAINRVHLYSVTCATSFAQMGAAAAFDGSQDIVDEMRGVYRHRRDLVLSLLREIPGITVQTPPGAFYAFPNVTSYALPSKTLAMRMVEEAGVGVVHGSAFGPAGEGHLRIAFACSDDDIREGIARMRRVLASL